jgi:flavin-dependent dehydrogenase
VSRGVDVFVVGGGPAGLAAAIAARQNGLHVTVTDWQRPPIDKACGEGLMPGAVAALQGLGLRFSSTEAIPFRGIRFLDGRTGLSAEALFSQGVGLAVRRTVLHAKLAERAAQAGATMVWGERITRNAGALCCGRRQIQSRWIVGADGQRSQVRKWAGLEPIRPACARFGFRQHFRIAHWSDLVEVYWGRSCQVAVTPTAPDEIGLAVIARSPRVRLQQALREMPVLAARVAGAPAATGERGAPCALRRLSAVYRGRFVLIGDASGSVDPVTGEGLGLAFHQAIPLAAGLHGGNLSDYQAAHNRIARIPYRLSQLILAMDRSAWLRRRALRVLAAEPGIFAGLVNAGVPGDASLLKTADALRLGWRLARPQWPD